MRCHTCSVFPGSAHTSCPGPAAPVDPGVMCTVRALSDSTVVHQGNVGAGGCSKKMLQHYNYLTDKEPLSIVIIKQTKNLKMYSAQYISPLWCGCDLSLIHI